MDTIISNIDFAKMTELGIIALMCVGFLFILREQAKGMAEMLRQQQDSIARICDAHGETARQAIEGYENLRQTLVELQEAFEALVDDRMPRSSRKS